MVSPAIYGGAVLKAGNCRKCGKTLNGLFDYINICYKCKKKEKNKRDVDIIILFKDILRYIKTKNR